MTNQLNFAGQDLTGRDFSNKILIGADFSGSDCTSCNFSNSDLSYANFKNSNLYRANFSQSILFVTRFEDCTLTRANFRKAFIYGIEFVGNVNVTYCDFSEPQLEITRRSSVFPADKSIYREIDIDFRVSHQFASTTEKVGFDFKSLFGSKIKCNGHCVEFNDYKPFEKEMQYSQIYNRLKRIHKENYFYNEAGNFYFLERQWERKSWFTRGTEESFSIKGILVRTSKTFFAWLIEIFTGYGERPLSLILWVLFGVFAFAGIYYNCELQYSDMENADWVTKAYISTYYSICTLTGLGASDITAIGVAKFFTAAESLFGIIIFALFTATIIRKMIRD